MKTLILLFLLVAGAGARAQSGNLMVADFEGGKVETVQGLALVPFTDEQLGGTSEARLTLSHPGADGSRGALQISFRITGDFPMPFGGVLAMLGPEGLATDLTSHKGVRFYARSKEKVFFASVGQFRGQAIRYMAPFETKPEWTLVELPFDKFQRVPPAGSPSPLVPKDVVAIGFGGAPQMRGQFDLDIDRLEIYR